MENSKAYYLIFIPTLVMIFLHVKVLPSLPIATINIFYYIFLIFFAMNYKKFSKNFDIDIVKIIILYSLYFFYAVFLDYYKEQEPQVSIMNGIRNIILIIMFIVLVSKEKFFKRTFIIIYILIVINIAFGLLIYIFGEPFQSIRDSIAGSERATELGQGRRISGFSSSLFGFSYVISPALVMGIIIFREKKSILYLLTILITALGFIFNGERSSFLVASIFSGALLLSIENLKKSHLVLIVSVIFFSFIGTIFLMKDNKNKTELESNEKLIIHRLGESFEGEYVQRVRQQLAGIMTIVKNPITGGREHDYEVIMHNMMLNKRRQLEKSFKNQYVIKYPAPHNHYINIGIRGGIIGIGLFIFFFMALRRCLLKFKNYAADHKTMKYYYIGTAYSLYALLGNGLFHNNGLAFGESTTWIFIGLVCAGCNINKRYIYDQK